MTGQIVYVSATPGQFELRNSIVGNTGYIANPGEQCRERRTPALLAGSDLRSESRTERLRSDHARTRSWSSSRSSARPACLTRRSRSAARRTRSTRPSNCAVSASRTSERVLVTTLTKRTAEDLTDYLRDIGLKVRYLHSDIDAIERVEILRGLRAGECDVLVGINLLREGLDLPEVCLVCILDADKEGYLRSQTSLIQTAG